MQHQPIQVEAFEKGYEANYASALQYNAAPHDVQFNIVRKNVTICRKMAKCLKLMGQACTRIKFGHHGAAFEKLIH